MTHGREQIGASWPAKKPSATPYLRFGEVERPIMGPAVEIVGNVKALLQLRAQIYRALRDDEGSCPLDEALYRDNFEDEYEVVVRKARCRAEMEPPRPPRPQKVPERLPWAEVARKQEEARAEDQPREGRGEV